MSKNDCICVNSTTVLEYTLEIVSIELHPYKGIFSIASFDALGRNPLTGLRKSLENFLRLLLQKPQFHQNFENFLSKFYREMVKTGLSQFKIGSVEPTLSLHINRIYLLDYT